MHELKLVTTYSQRDSNWANILLGFNTDTAFTIGNYGCLITSIVNYLNALGKTETPITFNDKTKAVNGFVSGGLYVWDSLAKLYPELVAYYISPRYATAVPADAWTKLKSLIDSGYLCLVEVDFNPSQAGEQMHWVLCYGYTDDGKYLIVDPWTGTKTTLDIYGDPNVAVYSFRCYAGKVGQAVGTVAVDADVFPKLVFKSGNYDKTVSYLEITTDPAETPFEKVQSVIGGFKSRITDLGNQLTTALTEQKNREEQVSRLKEQLLSEEQLRLGLTDQLNQDISKIQTITTLYEGQLKEKQAVADRLAKEKGELAQQLAAVQAQLQAKKGLDLATFIELSQALVKRIFGR